MFKVGQNVVYPMHGVGKIVSIEYKKVLDKKTKYYVIELLQGNIKIMVPVDKSEEIGLRSIISKREVPKVLRILKGRSTKLDDDWKTRYQSNTDKLRTGSIFDMAEVVRDLYQRNKEKELSLMEKKMYDTALNHISVEIALAKNIKQEESEKILNKILP